MLNRRRFIKDSLVTSALLQSGMAQGATSRKRENQIAIQIGAVSFVDEGEDQVLDNVQRLAGVNTLFLPVFAYNWGLAGRGYQSGGSSFRGAMPDHGKTDFDPDWFHGGYYATPHMKYYENTVFKDLRAPEFGDYDMLAAVIPKAHKRGMKVNAMMADNFKGNLPNAKKLFQVGLNGELQSKVCFNNPEYQGFLMGLIEDCTRSYPIDGLLWRSEKTGPLMEVLGAAHNAKGGGNPGCFCEFCRARAKKESISVERAVKGYEALRSFTAAGLSGERPVDGYYVTFWRILIEYPEILHWQRLFRDSLHDTYKAIHKKVKSIKPDLPVGWAFSSQQIYSHLFRADADLEALAGYTDFMKFYIYANVGGPRTGKYLDRLGKSIYADVPREQLLQFVYRIMGYGDEGSFDELRRGGYSADYVYRETQRARKGAEGTGIEMWPALDIDLPSRKYWDDFDDYSVNNPESLKQAVHAVFRAGSDRLLLARKYSEMRLTNLKAVGEAMKEIGGAF